MLEEFIHEPRIAYFSMEIALRCEFPTYAGGGHAIKYYRFDRALSVSVRTQCNYIN